MRRLALPGAIVTAGGLVFVAGDSAFHAYDRANGRELWKAVLTHRSSATPMTYRVRNGTQFVVIAV